MTKTNDLTIVIPSRNEMFLRNTVEDILKNMRGDTEIVAILDGYWPDPGIADHPKVTIVHYPVSIGQRAGCNEAVRVCSSKYVMKVDAHCSFDEGFDVVLMDRMQDDWTVVPTMRNLHAFNWLCKKCGNRRYQGPTPTSCPSCDNTTDFEREIVWIGKRSPQSNSYCFDSEPHFQYNGEYTHRDEYKNGIIVGYEISFDTRMVPSKIVSLLADFTRSHQLASGSYTFWGGKNMTVNAVSFSAIDSGQGVGAFEVDGVRYKLEMSGITATPILTNMIQDRNILSSSSRDGADQPSVGNSVCKLFLSEVGATSVASLINSSSPVPTSTYCINTDVINELNHILGGKFIYSEKTSSFHNGSVALKTIHDKDLTETMSLQGSCFMMTRDRYIDLNVCDEQFGSWGSQGIEVAVKSWLSGGRVLVNHRTWYAHMFRTQGGDFGFPYPISGRQTEHAKSMARELFFKNKWEKQIYPLSWLVEKFWPVPGWTEEELAELKKVEMVHA